MTDAYSISPSLLNEARGSISHTNEVATTPDTGATGGASAIGLPGAPYDVFPHINLYGDNILGGNGYLGLNGDNFFYINSTFYSLGDSVNWTKGRHTIKVGGEWNRAVASANFGQIGSGNFQFSGNATLNPATAGQNLGDGSSLADFLLGAVNDWNIYLPAITREASQTQQFYGTDSYKVRPNLTANYGVRVLHQGGFSEGHNQFGEFQPQTVNPDPTLPKGTLGAVGYGGAQLPSTIEKGKFFVQPRVGVAWAFQPGFSLRAGFGLYNIPWTANNYTNGLGTGFSRQNTVNPTTPYVPVFQLKNGAPPPLTFNRTADAFNGQNVPYQPYDTPINYLTEYQVDVQHEVKGYLIDVGYVGTKGTHLGFNSDLTQVPISQLGSATHPYPQYNSVYATLNSGTSHYNSLQIQSKKQLSQGISYTLAYTWSHNLDTGTGQGGFGTGQEISQDGYSTRANYGNSANDLRHVFNGSFVYELPFGRNRRFLNSNRVLDAAIGGWQFSSAFQAHTGTPFTPLVVNDTSGRFNGRFGGNLFPNQVASTASQPHTLAAWFDVGKYALPAQYTLGNARRNQEYGPHFAQIDMSAAKKFPLLNEKNYFELKMDALNATNHPNWGQPNASISANGTGAANITNFFPMRQIQLSGTVRF